MSARELLRHRGEVVAVLKAEGDVLRLKPTCMAPAALFKLDRLWACPDAARAAVREACEGKR